MPRTDSLFWQPVLRLDPNQGFPTWRLAFISTTDSDVNIHCIIFKSNTRTAYQIQSSLVHYDGAVAKLVTGWPPTSVMGVQLAVIICRRFTNNYLQLILLNNKHSVAQPDNCVGESLIIWNQNCLDFFLQKWNYTRSHWLRRLLITLLK